MEHGHLFFGMTVGTIVGYIIVYLYFKRRMK